MPKNNLDKKKHIKNKKKKVYNKKKKSNLVNELQIQTIQNFDNLKKIARAMYSMNEEIKILKIRIKDLEDENRKLKNISESNLNSYLPSYSNLESTENNFLF